MTGEFYPGEFGNCTEGPESLYFDTGYEDEDLYPEEGRDRFNQEETDDSYLSVDSDDLQAFPDLAGILEDCELHGKGTGQQIARMMDAVLDYEKSYEFDVKFYLLPDDLELPESWGRAQQQKA